MPPLSLRSVDVSSASRICRTERAEPFLFPKCGVAESDVCRDADRALLCSVQQAAWVEESGTGVGADPGPARLVSCDGGMRGARPVANVAGSRGPRRRSGETPRRKKQPRCRSAFAQPRRGRFDPLLATPGKVTRRWTDRARTCPLRPGIYGHGTDDEGPLTPKGRELLKEMERLGIILDVTHLCDESFWDALAHSPDRCRQATTTAGPWPTGTASFPTIRSARSWSEAPSSAWPSTPS